VVLTGRPQAAGMLTLRGCFIQTFGLVCEHAFPDSPSAQVTVTPPLPLMTARAHQHDIQNIIFEGQQATVDIELSNVGEQQIDYISVRITPLQEQQIFSWNAQELAAQLPLLATQCVHFPVHYIAKPHV
jgi:hypothetical protein